MRKSFFTAALFTGVALFPVLTAPSHAGTRFVEKSIPMGAHKSDERVFAESVRVSEDRRHITYVSRNHDGKVRIWIDGITGVAHDGASSPQFIPKSSRVGYIAASGGKMFAVIDGKDGPPYANADGLVFSPDGSRFAHRAKDEEGRVFAVVDGKPGPRLSNILPDPGIVFSPDSRHVVYVGVNEAGSQVLVKDQVPLRAFDQISRVVFSADSKHLAYAARSGHEWQVVHDDKAGRSYDNVAGLFFSHDGSQLAYMAEQNKRMVVVKDEKELFAGESAGLPFFSPDDSRFGFMMKKGKGWHLVMNGEKGPLIGRPDKIAFSDDSRHFAYSALIGDHWTIIRDTEKAVDGLEGVRFLSFMPGTSELLYVAVDKDGKEYLAAGDKKGKPYDSVGMPVIRPGPTPAVAYVAQNNKTMLLVDNGVEQTPCKVIGIPMKGDDGKVFYTFQYPSFSPDGQHMAYPAIDTQNRRFMVVDGKAHEYYEAVTEPVFSPDGKHIAYMAQKNGKWLVVVDGIEGRERFDSVLKGAGIVFDTDTSFYVLMLNLPGPSFYRLAVTIGEDKK